MHEFEKRQSAVVSYYQDPEIAFSYNLWGSLHYGFFPKVVDLTILDRGPAYNLHLESIDRMSRKIVSFLNPRPGSIVIDAGCGTGEMFRVLTEKDAKVYGVNITPLHLNIAQRRTIHNAHPARADYTHLPFPSESVDHVLLSQTLCHAPNQASVLLEADRVLKGGGSMVIVDTMLTKSRNNLTEQERRYVRVIDEGYRLDVTSHPDLVGMLEGLGYNIESEDYTQNVLPSLRYAAAGDATLSNHNLTDIEREHRDATRVTRDLNEKGLMQFIMVRATRPIKHDTVDPQTMLAQFRSTIPDLSPSVIIGKGLVHFPRLPYNELPDNPMYRERYSDQERKVLERILRARPKIEAAVYMEHALADQLNQHIVQDAYQWLIANRPLHLYIQDYMRRIYAIADHYVDLRTGSYQKLSDRNDGDFLETVLRSIPIENRRRFGDLRSTVGEAIDLLRKLISDPAIYKTERARQCLQDGQDGLHAFVLQGNLLGNGIETAKIQVHRPHGGFIFDLAASSFLDREGYQAAREGFIALKIVHQFKMDTLGIAVDVRDGAMNLFLSTASATSELEKLLTAMAMDESFSPNAMSFEKYCSHLAEVAPQSYAILRSRQLQILSAIRTTPTIKVICLLPENHR